MNRYEDVTPDVLELAKKIQKEYFPENETVSVKYLFDTKEKKSEGRTVLGTCQKASDLVRLLTKDEVEDLEGFAYIIYLDKLAYTNMNEEDKIRLIRHEQRHIHFDLDATKQYKINPHNVEDFIEEIELNKEDISWATKNAAIVSAMYEQAKNKEKEKDEFLDIEVADTPIKYRIHTRRG